MNDWNLLSQYADDGSEQAFEELVKRHMPMVHSSAVRRVGANLADEVTQAVFAILARKSSLLARKKVRNISGWLYKTTRYAALSAIRENSRRSEREHEAAERELMIKEEQRFAGEWLQVRPLLEAAMDNLNGQDREAVLLRFYQDASYEEVGDALGISENSAAKRVSRALDKMSVFLSRKGVTVAASGLAVCLGANCVEAAPTAVAAVGALTSGAAGSALVDTTLKVIAVAKLKAAALVLCAAGAAAGVVTGGAAVLKSQQEPLRLERIEPVPFRYKGRSMLSNGSEEYQLNMLDSSKTVFVSVGDEVRGWLVADHQFIEAKRKRPGIGGLETADASELTLERSGSKIVMVIDKENAQTNFIAHIVSTDNNSAIVGGIHSVFSDGNTKYRIASIDSVEGTVVLIDMVNGSEITLSL